MPEPVDLYAAIGMPPEEAIEYFREKGYAFSWSWVDVWQEAHLEAFTVAKAMTLDILESIRTELDKAILDGTTFSDFLVALEGRLQSLGWWGKDPETGATLGTPWRLATIFRTNLQTAYARGRYEQLIENVDDRPWWQYVAVMDLRTRPTHAAMNGLVFRYDDVVWETHLPPLGFNCRCRIRALTDKDLSTRGLIPRTGSMTEKTVTVGSGDSQRDETVTGYVDSLTGQTLFTDPGWSYNKLGGYKPPPPVDLPPIDPTFGGDARARWDSRLEAMALQEGMTPDELRLKFRELAQKAVSGSRPFMRSTRKDMLSLLSKAGLEYDAPLIDPIAGLFSKTGALTRLGDAQFGEAISGVGYLSKDARGRLESYALDMMGDVAIELHDGVMKAAYVQRGALADLNGMLPAAVPSPGVLPDEYMIAMPMAGKDTIPDADVDGMIPYFLSFLRPIVAADVKMVHINGPASIEVKAKLTRLGIPFTEGAVAIDELDDEIPW